MPRIQNFFASAAVGFLVLGLLALRLRPKSEMVVTVRHTGYALPYSLLCYGVALFFCLFAVLYSAGMVSWSVRTANWHFGVSLLLVALFCAASVSADHFLVRDGSSSMAMPVLATFTFSPVLFLLVQLAFLLDALRRIWPLFGAKGHLP